MLKTEISSIICFSPEEEPQLAIKKFDAYEGWKTELYKPFMESREFEIEEEGNQIIATRNMRKEKTIKVQLSK